MKSASAFALICCASVFAILSLKAQEHVDVPLPPYDPPPTTSHRSQATPDEPRRSTSKPRAYDRNTIPKKTTKDFYSDRNRKRTKPPPSRHHSRPTRRTHFLRPGSTH